jgi:hypothetical protein
MAASVSGSLAEVRTAKALLLLVDEMAFDSIANPLTRDADMVAPLPLQVPSQRSRKSAMLTRRCRKLTACLWTARTTAACACCTTGICSSHTSTSLAGIVELFRYTLTLL